MDAVVRTLMVRSSDHTRSDLYPEIIFLGNIMPQGMHGIENIKSMKNIILVFISMQMNYTRYINFILILELKKLTTEDYILNQVFLKKKEIESNIFYYDF